MMQIIFIFFFPKALPCVFLIDFVFQRENEKKAKEYLEGMFIFVLASPQNETGEQNKITDIYGFISAMQS